MKPIIKSINTPELESTFPNISKDLNNSLNLNYSIIQGKEKEELILDILKKIDEDVYHVGSKQLWNLQWEQIYQEFIRNNYDLDCLVPKFISVNQSNYQPLRYNNEFIRPTTNTFWIDYYSLFRKWLFDTYLKESEHVYEFGCGSGYNLVALSQLNSIERTLYGLDFSPGSMKIIDKVHNIYNYNIKGNLFDMLNPNLHSLKLEDNCTVCTMNSIEQLGGKFYSFIQYLLKQKIRLCIHVEPTIEFHDPNNLMDWLSIKFMEKRKYSTSLLTYLKHLESDNRIKILEAKRVPLGNLMSNCYTYIIWYPLNTGDKL